MFGKYFEKELEKTWPTYFKVERVIRRKGDKLFVTWKGYGNSFIVRHIKKT